MSLSLRSRLGQGLGLWLLIFGAIGLTSIAWIENYHRHPKLFDIVAVAFVLSVVAIFFWWAFSFLFFNIRSRMLRKNRKKKIAYARKDLLLKGEDKKWHPKEGCEEEIRLCEVELDLLEDKIRSFDDREDECVDVVKKIGLKILWFTSFPFKCFGRILKKGGISITTESIPAATQPQDARDNSSVGQVTVTGEKNAKTTPSPESPSPSTTLPTDNSDSAFIVAPDDVAKLSEVLKEEAQNPAIERQIAEMMGAKSSPQKPNPCLCRRNRP
jgi:hypothetical protein